MVTSGKSTRDPLARLAVHEGEGGDVPVDERTVMAIAALRSRIEEEFQITQRWDQKGRQLFALAAGFFAVAQAVAFGSFRQSHVPGVGLVITGIIAGLAICALVAAGHNLANAEDPQPELDIDPARIEHWARDDNDLQFGRKLVVHMRQVAEARAASNKLRKERYQRIESAARFALITTAFEMAVAIAFRL
jgi:hypothetical protein